MIMDIGIYVVLKWAADMHPPTDQIDRHAMIPDLLRAAPYLRPVLDRYGLRGCGGPLGPHETLDFFARAHDVPIEQLLSDLRACRPDAPPPAPAPEEDRAAHRADTIYRPFFTAGILVVLTLGATWGAYLLLRIGLGGSFTAVDVHEVNAHGHAQIFGWVGLFVMGFAYQAFPRFKHTALALPGVARLSLWLMAGGLAARSLLHVLASTYPGLIVPAAAASLAEVVAAGLFAWVILATWRRSGKPMAFYDWYILCALGWFVVQAVYEGVYLTATLCVSGPALVGLVATWQAPLRDLQIHGFALLMILGVSQRLLHHMYGLPAPRPRRGLAALVMINVAVVAEAAGLVLMRLAGPEWAGLWYAGVLLLAAATAWLVAGWGLFGAAPERERTLKFIRAAYVWLFVSLGMLVLLPAYQHGWLAWAAPESHAAQIGFSHAYYGAIRHAITVGFVSLMIVGVAARVVPTLNGIDGNALPRLWAPFLLLNGGCALRVVGQTLTDSAPLAFPFTGVSGLLEVTGLALWGVHLWRIMSGRHPLAVTTDEDASPAPDRPLCATDRVADVISWHPGLMPVFRSFGFHALSNPLLRRTVARRVTLEQACRVGDVDLDTFLIALNAARPAGPRRMSLHVLGAADSNSRGASVEVGGCGAEGGSEQQS